MDSINILKIINALPERLRPQEPMNWNSFVSNAYPLEESLKFYHSLPVSYKPGSLGEIPDFSPDDLVDDPNELIRSLKSLAPNNPRWSPAHKKSVCVLAPVFFVVRDLTKNEFETWLSLTQLARVELLRMCARSNKFPKLDLLIPAGLDNEGLTTFFQDALFPGKKWITEDLQRSAIYLKYKEQTPAVAALRRLLEAAIPHKGRLP
ncbi:MAG: hypothetical protein ACRCYZ_05690 [Alphaproteobacteria bacterium]